MMKRIYILSLAAVLLAACHTEDLDLKKQEKGSGSKVAAGSVTTASSIAKTISFAGYTWNVRQNSVLEGPGPNYFSGNNVWVDSNGRLHLKLSKNPNTGGWECAELYLNKTLGYGTYQWKIDGALDKLDKNVVFGLFNYSGNDRYDEQDIEFSKWGVQDNNNMLNYTVWPATGSSQAHVEVTYPFSLNGTWTTHRFKRTSNSISFKSLHGFYDTDTNVFASKTWTNPPTSISQLAMPVYMNLWCFKGVPPSNGQNVEIIVYDFKYIPL
jgi:hypothetical protein